MDKKYFMWVIGLFCYINSANAVTLVSEDFNDKAYTYPLTYYNITGYDQGIIYNNSNSIGGTGYSLQFNHSQSMAGVGILQNFASYTEAGVYIRYWVNYPVGYKFPCEVGAFENLKMFKLAGDVGWDIEFIYKNTCDGGPSSLQLFWNGADGTIIGNGTVTGSTTLGAKLNKGEWHKIEIYLKIGSDYSDQAIHVQVDDYDVYKETGSSVNFRLPASAYTGTSQFMSIWAGTPRPLEENGEWYHDNVTIVHNEGDLCNNEPSEPDGLVVSSDDVTPPGDATNFTAQVGDSQIALSWTNPTDSDFSGTMVRYSTGSDPYPATHTDGILVCDRVGTPGSNDGCTATGLQNGVQYNFSAFTYDLAGNYSETAHVSAIPIAENSGDVTTQVWDASDQTGDFTWSDSGVVWTARVLVQGSAITSVPGANMVTLGFQGRASADYQVSKISIAEKDPNVAEADVVDSTWAKVTFDGNSVSSWGTDRMTVPLGMEKLTDAIPFMVEPGKDYYVTFQMNSASTYLYAPLGYRELYFDSTDMAERAEDVDWSGNGYSVYAQRVHAISAIYASTADTVVIQPVKDFRFGQ